MKKKEGIWKFLILFLLVGIGIWIFKKQPADKKAIVGPKETQYFCNLDKNKTIYTLEVIGLDWIKRILSIRSLDNEFPVFNQEILKKLPDLESPFNFQNDKINFKTVDDKDEWVNPINMDPESLISPVLDWHGNKYSQAVCPWQEDQFITNIKDLFLKKKISILCFHNSKTSANSVFVLNAVKNISWIFGTESLKDWKILSSSTRVDANYYIEGNSLFLDLGEGKKTNFKISKKSDGQLQELKSKDITLSQDACTWISKAAEIAQFQKRRNTYYCLKPFLVGGGKTFPKDIKPKGNQPNNYKKNKINDPEDYPQVSSVIQINQNQKTFSFFGNFLGDKLDLFEKPDIQGTITVSGHELLFFSENGKKVFTGSHEEKGIKIKDQIFKNEYCPF